MAATLPVSHIVSRSSELLSCAKTALKIAQSSPEQLTPQLNSISPNNLALYNTSLELIDAHVDTCIKDGLTLLRQMKSNLDTLSSLVKRRGHTNDPTSEIEMALSQWEEAAKELKKIRIGPTPLLNKQQARHYELVSAWLDVVVAQQAAELKTILKARATVLQEQAQRRKLLNPSNKAANGSTASTMTRRPSSSLSTSKNAMNSPLFAVTNNNAAPARVTAQNGHQYRTHHAPPARQSSLQAQPIQSQVNGSLNGGTVSSAPSSFSGSGYGRGNSTSSGYGGGTSAVGYGGTGYGGASYYNNTNRSNMGMRQRKGVGTSTSTDADSQQQDTMQVQIQERQARRETRSRLQDAQQAESKLAELGTLFGKMSTLISQQGEVLEKVEDDVEAAYGDVSAGEQEIQTLYSIKKGNRALILKVFAILIFFIIFMRLY